MAETYQGKTREEVISIKVAIDHPMDAVHLHAILDGVALEGLYGPAMLSEVLEKLTQMMAEEAFAQVKKDIVSKVAERIRRIVELV